MTKGFAILIFLFSFSYSNGFKLPFKKIIYPDIKSNDSDLIDAFTFNYIAVPIAFGTPPQTFNFLLEFNSYGFGLINSDADGISPNQKGFRYSESNSFKQISESPMNFNHKIRQGYISSETITLNNKQIRDMHFIQVSQFVDLPIVSGLIGLDINGNGNEEVEKTNFIYQLKKKDEMTTYAYSIKYTNKDEGEFIFGELPHLIDNTLKDKTLKWEKTLVMGDILNWGYSFDTASSGIVHLQAKTVNAIIGIEYGIIFAPFIYYKAVRQFFDPLLISKKCEEKLVLNFYFSYICDDDINISKYDDLIFTKGPYSFVLTKDDLFIKVNNKYVFLVVFAGQTFSLYFFDWIFGAPFFKKYQMVFDQDKKMIGVYVDAKVKDPRESFGLWWIPIILGALIILALFYFIYLKFRSKGLMIKQYDSIDYDYTSSK